VSPARFEADGSCDRIAVLLTQNGIGISMNGQPYVESHITTIARIEKLTELPWPTA
jgi:hypothetical protein